MSYHQKKPWNDALCMFSLSKDQQLGLKSNQTHNWCLIHFDHTPPERVFNFASLRGELLYVRPK